jgi:hypothetical protein
LKLGFQRVSSDVRPEVDIGDEVLVGSGEGENTDELREVTVNPSMSSRCSMASSRRGKRRLETGRRLHSSDKVEPIDSLHKNLSQGLQMGHQGERGEE